MNRNQTPKTRKFLLLRYQNQVSVAEREHHKTDVIQFKGETVTEFDANFWDRMIRYVSYETGQPNDLCLIAEDDEWNMPDKLKNAQIHEQSVWNAQTIDEAMKEMRFDFSVTVLSQGGQQLCRYLPLQPRDEAFLTAVFAGSEAMKETVPAKEPQPKPAPKPVRIRKMPEEARSSTGLTDEEYMEASPLCRFFVDQCREAEERGRRT